MRYKITIEYEGTYFNGWQKQDNTSTIQGNLESALYSLAGQNIDVFACGRTDSGVHALNQVAHFDIEKEYNLNTLKKALNYYLAQNIIKQNIEINKLLNTKQINYLNNNSIIVKDCEIVDNDFHARFSSKMRHYKYIILNQPEFSPFYFNRAWHIRNKLDVDKMREASQLLIGKHDFTSFRSTECQALSPIKTLNKIKIYTHENEIIFEFSAKSFLHHMVRNIVGTLKDVGFGKIEVNEITNILEAKDRQKAGVMAPACGLYFLGVEY